MRCDECKYWLCLYTDFGECSVKLGTKVDVLDPEGCKSIISVIETDADFFCAAFEGKDDD
jgi:hypothetical protein